MARVLVIDDDAQIRQFLRVTLQSAGHEVAEADDGASGIKEFGLVRFDIVVCDIFMPQTEGLTTILALRKIEPSIKIIAISGGPRDYPTRYFDPLPDAMAFGAGRILHKPFTVRALLAAVDDLLLLHDASTS